MATDMMETNEDFWFNDMNENNNNYTYEDLMNDETISVNDRMYYRYFYNLSNYNDNNSLVDFSKAYICDKLTTKIVNIHGDSFSGKSLLLTLLNRYVNSTTLKAKQLNKYLLHHFNGRYIIVEVNDDDNMYEYMNVIKELTGKYYRVDRYDYYANYTFIFVSKSKLPNYFRQNITYVGLENKFNNSNIEFSLMEDPEAFKNFITY